MMETLVLVALGIMALTILFIRSRQTIKGFSQDYEGNHCAGCGSCCSSACDHRKERMGRI